MAAPRALGALTPPPRPLHVPLTHRPGQTDADGRTDGHGAPRWWVLKEGDDAGRGGAAVRRQRPGPAGHRHRHRLLAAAPGARRHRGHRAVAPLPGGALPAPPPGPPAFWDATRVLMLLAVLAAAAGFALGLSAAAAGAARRARARAAGVTLLLAGVLALLGLAVCTAGARSLLGPAPGAWRLSWSYLLAWVAVVLTGSAGLFHLCAAAKDPSPESSESGGP